MPPVQGPVRLRVAVLGAAEGESEWVPQLTGQALEVASVDTQDGLFDPSASLAVAFVAPEQAAALARTAAERASAPPLVLLVGRDAEAHPHVRLLRALIDGKNDWERTFDAIVDPVAVIDREGRIVRANLGLARALDQPISKIVSSQYSTLLGQPEGADPIAASLADGEPRSEEACFARLPGTWLLTTSPFADRGGGRGGLVAILKDVSEQKEHEERLRRASRMADIGQLAAGVAHEINTPLASIALRAESLLKAAQDPRLQAIDAFANFPRYLKTIDEEIFRCKKIIGALLDFSRARRPEVRRTDLNALAEGAADLVRHQMKLKNVDLALRLHTGLPPIAADDGQLRQALIALLMNALDATAPGGRVEIATHRDGEDSVSLTVSDNGVGIAPENLDKVFTPFFTTKPVGQGTGLGLAICHGIVAAHGGDIRVSSEVGRGTSLSLLFPIAGLPQPAAR